MVRSHPDGSRQDWLRARRSRSGAIGLALAAALAWLGSAGGARADTAEEFYKSHPLSIVIGFPAGSAYDLYGRVVGRHIGKHIPGNPAVLPVNKPGASSLTAANYLYSIAPKDGSTIGILSRGAPLDPLLNNAGSKFEPRKFFWLGSVGNEVSVCVAWHAAAVKTWDDLLVKDFVVAAAGMSTDTGAFSLVLEEFVRREDEDHQRLSGRCRDFQGDRDRRGRWPLWLVVERGQGQQARLAGRDEDQCPGPARAAEGRGLPFVPLITDLAKTDEQRQILKLVFGPQEFAWPFMAPPDLPPDRKQLLRAAFDATLADPEFRADARKMALEVNPVSGRRVEALIDELYGTPDDVVAKTRRVIATQ